MVKLSPPYRANGISGSDRSLGGEYSSGAKSNERSRRAKASGDEAVFVKNFARLCA